ncbi:MAG: phage major capsid protein, partial [Atopobiaceae bacterium]|nr:phage major capsid protein [Atopobiaceae bacterium]
MAYPTDHIDINRGTTGLTLTPEQSNEILAKAVEQSAVMRLAERVSLPGAGLSIPVITGEPVADFVAETAEKPVSNATFSTKTMTPYKIAVIEMFSMEFRRDFRRLYDELVRRLPAALSTKFDATVFHGSTPGTGFDVLTNATAVDIATDPYAGLVE